MTETTTRNCPWGYSCKKTWESLQSTREEGVRFCGDCQKEVFWVGSQEELAAKVMLNRCVCFSSSLLGPEVADEESVVLLVGSVDSSYEYGAAPKDKVDDDFPF
ncbi:MAG: hypothetical protein NXI15_10770 [Gammaproteobacteria bacterium]|nr:hypothetical protein [Gammaproteobacteria bacterium]